METLEELKQRVQREKQLAARLQMASARLEAAQQERIWAIVAANEAGLSIRQIAVATGLSPSRIHQLLQAPESKNIPVWHIPPRTHLVSGGMCPYPCPSPHQRFAHSRGGSPALVY